MSCCCSPTGRKCSESARSAGSWTCPKRSCTGSCSRRSRATCSPPHPVRADTGWAGRGDQADPDALLDGLGTRWELPGILFKPCPCNHFTRAGIDAALRLRARSVDPAVDPSRIEGIELGVAAAVLRTIGEPRADKFRPESGCHAAFSGPYAVAAALLGGGGLGLSHEDFTDEAAADPARLALAAKVTCAPDTACDRIFPHQFPAVLRVHLRGGEEFVERVPVDRGGPDSPLSAAEPATKFRLNAAHAVDAARAGQITERTHGLAELDDVTALTALLSAT